MWLDGSGAPAGLRWAIIDGYQEVTPLEPPPPPRSGGGAATVWPRQIVTA